MFENTLTINVLLVGHMNTKKTRFAEEFSEKTFIQNDEKDEYPSKLTFETQLDDTILKYTIFEAPNEWKNQSDKMYYESIYHILLARLKGYEKNNFVTREQRTKVGLYDPRIHIVMFFIKDSYFMTKYDTEFLRAVSEFVMIFPIVKKEANDDNCVFYKKYWRINGFLKRNGLGIYEIFNGEVYNGQSLIYGQMEFVDSMSVFYPHVYAVDYNEYGDKKDQTNTDYLLKVFRSHYIFDILDYYDNMMKNLDAVLDDLKELFN